MPVLQRLATATEQEGLGMLQELTSPVLGKLKEALIFTRLAYAQRRAFGSRTHVLDGKFTPTIYAFSHALLHIKVDSQESTTPRCTSAGSRRRVCSCWHTT